MSWLLGPIAGADTETTGVNVETDRVVTICWSTSTPKDGGGRDRQVNHAVIDPGIPVPDEAASIHGWTTERVQAEGKPPIEVLDLYVADLAAWLAKGLPAVLMNAAFDLTILDRECRRHGLPTLTDRLDGAPVAPIVDPMVIDKYFVPLRRRVSKTQGARCLQTICEVHGAGWDADAAHQADYDATQAVRAVWFMARKFPMLATMPLAELHARQVEWAAEQAEGLANYFRGQGLHDKADGVWGDWPLLPYQGQGGSA